MNHDDAAALRATLNGKPYVQAPDDGADDPLLSLVRVRQPGYLDGEPHYEVVAHLSDRETYMLPQDLLRTVSEAGGYLRVDGRTLHVREATLAGDHNGGSAHTVDTEGADRSGGDSR